MSDNIFKKVDKSDLDNVRQLIEKEIIDKGGEKTLDLTEIFQEGIKKVSSNKRIDDKEIFKKLIRNQIQDVLREELKHWFDNSLPLIIEPYLKEYLISSGSKKLSNSNENEHNNIAQKENFSRVSINKSKSLSQNFQKKINNKNKISNKRKTNTNVKKKSTSIKDLEKMTKVELQIFGKKHGVIIDRRKNKDKIIAELKKISI
tara:strand:+ start:151 stop:759 length:609 start_codon:yes stop_codon:yes gene_type:complete